MPTLVTFAEPMQKRHFVPGARRAAVLLWGEDGLNDIARRIPDDAREEFFRAGTADEWIPTRHVIAWCFATWFGPAQQVRTKMAEYLDRQFDFGAGVIRRAVLRMADPAGLVPRMPTFWRQDNSSGDLSATLDEGGKSISFRLVDHPYTETPHARASIAEVYRYAFSQTRAKDVTESHGLEGPGVMTFRIRWK